MTTDKGEVRLGVLELGAVSVWHDGLRVEIRVDKPIEDPSDRFPPSLPSLGSGREWLVHGEKGDKLACARVGTHEPVGNGVL
jgi:hypothetical protein